MARKTPQPAKLDDDMKGFIVQALACFEKPSAVADAVKERYGVEITRQAIEAYNPLRYAGRALPEKWKLLFEQTRTKWSTEAADIAIAHRAYRLKQLQDMVEKALERKNIPLAQNLLKQAAEEVGEVFTNRRELTGKGGKDLPASSVSIFALPDNGRG